MIHHRVDSLDVCITSALTFLRQSYQASHLSIQKRTQRALYLHAGDKSCRIIRVIAGGNYTSQRHQQSNTITRKFTHRVTDPPQLSF